MNNLKKNIVLLIALSGFILLGSAVAEQKKAAEGVPSGPAESLKEIQSALRREDYEKVWSLFSSAFKQEEFNDDFETFKEKIIENKVVESPFMSDIKEVKILPSGKKAIIEQKELVNGQPAMAIMVNEDGKWKFAGKVDDENIMEEQ